MHLFVINECLRLLHVDIREEIVSILEVKLEVKMKLKPNLKLKPKLKLNLTLQMKLTLASLSVCLVCLCPYVVCLFVGLFVCLSACLTVCRSGCLSLAKSMTNFMRHADYADALYTCEQRRTIIQPLCK